MAGIKQAFEQKQELQTPVQYSVDEKPVVDIDLRYCPKKDRPRMISMVNRLAKSELGLETLRIAAENGYHFNFIRGENRAFGFADPCSKRIALNPKFPDEKLIGTMCHECRHAGQFSRASDLSEEKWDVRTNLMYMRAMEADAQAYAASACEQLFRQGDKGPKEQFYKYYPEIAKGFSAALEKNNGELGHQLLTDTFKAWYDQLGTKSVYEEGYLLEPMQQELRNIANGKGASMTFETTIDAKKTISEICWTKDGNYFKDDPEILNNGKYMDVCEFTMDQMKKFFEYRKEMTGKDDAKALDNVPTRRNTHEPRVPEMKKPHVKNGVEANAQRHEAMAARLAQMRALAAKRGR